MAKVKNIKILGIDEVFPKDKDCHTDEQVDFMKKKHMSVVYLSVDKFIAENFSKKEIALSYFSGELHRIFVLYSGADGIKLSGLKIQHKLDLQLVKEFIWACDVLNIGIYFIDDIKKIAKKEKISLELPLSKE